MMPLLPILCLLLLVPAVRAGAQGPPVFEDSTSVVVVEVPVNVVRDGAPVRGLTADDFEVYDGRRRRPLVDFEVVDLDTVAVGDAGPRDGVPIAARRHFLLLFDVSNTGGPALRRSLAGARELLGSALHPSDLVAVGVYGRRGGAGLLLGFTPDRRQVSSVLDLLEGREEDGATAEQSLRDPLRLMAGGSLAQLGGEDLAAEMADGLSGRAGMLAETLGDMSRANTARQREVQRSAFAALADGLGELADGTARVDGRKFLVFFSRDWPTDLFYELEDDRRSLLDAKAGARSLRDLDQLVDRFRRGGWTVQAVDAGGLQEGAGLAAGGLFTALARETGGEVYRNFNDLGTAMGQMLGKSSVTYVLTFRADGVENDGAFHPIRVELRDGERGARLLHRSGYFAPSPDESEGERRLGLAEQILSGESGGELEVSTLSAVFRGPGGTGEGHVAVWVEVPGPQLSAAGGASGGGERQVEVYAYAFDPAGEIHDFFTRTVTLDLAKVGERLARSALALYGDFDLAPGDYELRLLVRDPASGRHALRVHPFTVAPFVDGAPRLLPPLLIDDEGDALVVRQRPADGEADRYPFVLGDGEVFVPMVDPAIDPELRPRGRVCLMGYHLIRDDLLLGTGLVAADGTPLAKDRLLVVGRADTAEDGLDRLYLSLDAGGLAAGEYQLLVSVHDPERGVREETFMPFRVDG